MVEAHGWNDRGEGGLARVSLFYKKSESGQRTGTRILRSCAAFHFVFATRNNETLPESGKIHGGIRRSRDPSAEGLKDTSTLPLFCQSQFGGEGNFVA
jgi:hypothetical protein